MDDRELLKYLSRFFLAVFAEDRVYSVEVLDVVGVDDIDDFYDAAMSVSEQSV